MVLGSVASACDDGGNAPVLATTTTTAAPTAIAKDLAGLIGTAPRVDMDSALRARIDALDSTLDADTPAAARPYDATIIAVLAAEVARVDSPARIAANISGITHDGDACFSYDSCRDLTDTGVDIDYNGPSGDIDLLGDGQSGDGTFAVWQVNAAGVLTQISTESADVTPPTQQNPVPDPASGPRADGRLVIGMVLPSSGPQESVAAAARAGIRAAVNEVNSNGGALGRPVQLVLGDAGDGSDEQLDAAVRVVLDAGADVVIGGLESSDTSRLVESVVGAGVVLISPGQPTIVTSPRARSGLFFRMTPPATIQARALAAAVADDGHTATVVIHTADADGLTMLAAYTAGFEAVDGRVAAAVGVNPTGADAATAADAAIAAQPQAIAIIAPDLATAAVLRELRARAHSPSDVPTFVANLGPALLAAAH